MQDLEIIKALANDRRLMILHWLKDPRAHFAPQVDGDLERDGVCALFLAEKLGVTQATLSAHMRLLVQTGLVRSKRIKQWISIAAMRNESARSRQKCLPIYESPTLRMEPFAIAETPLL